MTEQSTFIEKVKDNQQKRKSFEELMKLYKKAKEAGFYLECLWIIYAMLEDRTSAFLYHLGFTSANNRNRVTGTKKIRNDVVTLFNIDIDKPRYNFNSLAGKINRINTLFANQERDNLVLTDFQSTIFKTIEFIKDLDLTEKLTYLETEWITKRNQLTHALFSKQFDAARDETKILCEKGFEVVRRLDLAAKKIKRKHIRSKYNIQ